MIKNKLIQGTIILTMAGLITRVIGFIYRIFLSRNIGEEGMGIYQLLTPIITLSFSLTCAGIQTSVSKHVSAFEAKQKPQYVYQILYTGIIVSVTLSIFTGFMLSHYANIIADRFLDNINCINLIRIYAIALPFCAIHSCLNGYFFGLKKTIFPAVTQFSEQIIRVTCVYILFINSKNQAPQQLTAYAVIGIVCGECSSAILSLLYIYCVNKKQKTVYNCTPNITSLKNLFSLSVPLTVNRVTLNFMQSTEAAFLPQKLKQFGMSPSDSVAAYGIFSGMALPMILFPQALTGSISILLLPYISEAETQNNHKKITKTLRINTAFCVALGLLCMFFFYCLGPIIGNVVFHCKKAGKYIQILSFMCPFLYLGTTLSGILNGLGKATLLFLFNLCSVIIRVIGVFLLVPSYGMIAYFNCILLSQILFCVLNLLALKKYLYYNIT